MSKPRLTKKAYERIAREKQERLDELKYREVVPGVFIK